MPRKTIIVPPVKIFKRRPGRCAKCQRMIYGGEECFKIKKFQPDAGWYHGQYLPGIGLVIKGETSSEYMKRKGIIK